MTTISPYTKRSKNQSNKPLYTAMMLLCVTLVCDTHKQQIVGVLRYLGGILPALNLFYGGVNGLVVFQLNDDGGAVNILSGDEHQVGKALACGQLTVDDVVVGGVIVGDTQHTGQ